MKIKKTLYTTEEMLQKFREEAEKMLSNSPPAQDLEFSKQDIKELLHQIQVQHIELEMQNDELKLSNEEMETQRQKFAGLYDVAPVGYFILDSHGIISEVNTTGCSLLETNKRIMLNRRLQSFIDPEDGEFFYSFLKKTISSKTRQSCQLNLLTPKGNRLYAQIEGIAVPQLSGQPQNCYIAIIDITERRLSELKLTETKERLEMALDASVAGTWQIDLRTEEISLDKFSCQIYGLGGCSSKQSIETFVKMIHPEDRRYASKRFGEAISHKKDLDMEYRIIKPDQNVAYVSARGHVVENPSMCFVGILMDITERKELEKIAFQLKEEHQKNIMTAVFRTQENERKRISEALHDSVSQLLYGIKLKLQDYKKLDKDAQIFNELNTLIEQAVDETRDISFELAPSILTDFGLATTLNEMVKRLNTGNLKISTKISGLTDRIELGKELSIFRIIQELVNNVIKHAKATQLKIELIKKNKDLIINVSDNGKGFDVVNNQTTSGSGLHSIKNRLDLLNGTMTINSTEGAGSIVNIIFKDIA